MADTMQQPNNAVSEVRETMLRAQVYVELKRLILSGALRSGERLHERDLTEQLGVSRTPIREALTQLVSDGLVVNRPQRGHFVQSYDAKTVDDLYRLRAELEKYAVELVIARLEPAEREEFERIKLLLSRYSGNVRQSAEELRDSFLVHELIARTSKDQFLYEILSRMFERLTLFVWLDALLEDDAELTRQEHANLIDAILDGQAEVASKLVVEHIERSHSNVRRALERRPALASLPSWANAE